MSDTIEVTCGSGRVQRVKFDRSAVLVWRIAVRSQPVDNTRHNGSSADTRSAFRRLPWG